MAEYDQKQANNTATPTSYGRIDEEAQIKELRRQKRIKYIKYGVAFAVFQTGIILIFALTVMKIKTPKFRVLSVSFETSNVPNSSFDITMNAQLGVKNTNFGHYKYDNSSITFFYRGQPVGNANINKARAKARSTRKFNVTVHLASDLMENDVISGNLTLNSLSTLRGKVELMKVMKKKKSTQMNCTMEINIPAREFHNLACK